MHLGFHMGDNLRMIKAEEFIHSTYTKTPDGDAVVVKLHVHHDDGTIKPALKIIRNPKRTYGITKPGSRNHRYKKEFEDVDKLDIFTCYNHDLSFSIAEKLYGYRPKQYMDIRKLAETPYLYGAGVDIQTLIKHEYRARFKRSGCSPSALTTGVIDIETDVRPGGKEDIILITVTHEDTVYTAILRSFFVIRDKQGNAIPGNLQDLSNFSKVTIKQYIDDIKTNTSHKNHKTLKKILDTKNFKFKYYIGDTPKDLVMWIFERIKENKTDFVGVWNIDFDIPKILSALSETSYPKRSNIVIKDPSTDVISTLYPKELPDDVKYVRYQFDPKNVDHISKKWHWLHLTGHTQFFDSMCLYSLLRTVQGKETDYKLNTILESNGLNGKLNFKKINTDIDEEDVSDRLDNLDWHRHMQVHEVYKYIVYNQGDGITVQIMNWLNSDIDQMYSAVGDSHLSKYARQTVKLSDSMHFFALEYGRMIGTASANMVTEFDAALPRVGGAVLSPSRTDQVGMKIFKNDPSRNTMMHAFVNDIDFSSMYPSVTDGASISKQTKRSTVVSIDGLDYYKTQNYFSLVISTPENAVKIGHDYYRLPSYEEMDKHFASLGSPQPDEPIYEDLAA